MIERFKRLENTFPDLFPYEILRENSCRRNVITYNMGKISQQYIDCINTPNLTPQGKIIGIDIEYDLSIRM